MNTIIELISQNIVVFIVTFVALQSLTIYFWVKRRSGEELVLGESDQTFWPLGLSMAVYDGKITFSFAGTWPMSRISFYYSALVVRSVLGSKIIPYVNFKKDKKSPTGGVKSYGILNKKTFLWRGENYVGVDSAEISDLEEFPNILQIQGGRPIGELLRRINQ